jgi:hypothetical protein
VASIEGWIIVCRDFHGARGVYRTQAEAEQLARKQTEYERTGSGCKYEAVPCELNFERTFN